MENQIVNDNKNFIHIDENHKINSDNGIEDKISTEGNQNFSKTEENSSETLQSYSILDIEEFLKNGKIPPGIKEYDDLPSLESSKPSESHISKCKKPWDTDENFQNLNFIEN